MELWIYNKAFEHVGILDTFDTAIFEWHYCDISKCTIYAKFTQETHQMLLEGNYISQPPKFENNGYFSQLFGIEMLRYSINETQEPVIECVAFTLSNVLKRRYAKRNCYFANKKYKDILQSLFNTSFKDGVNNAKAVIDNLYFEYLPATNDVATGDVYGQSLHDIFRTLLLQKKYGFYVKTNIETKAHTLVVYQGNNLVQGDNIYIVSTDNERLLLPELIKDNTNYYNSAFSRFTDNSNFIDLSATTATQQAIGWEYKELYQSISIPTQKTEGSDEKYTPEEMQNIGNAFLLAELKKCNKTVTFNCKVSPTDYGNKYTLGDQIIVQMPEWNFIEQIHINGVIETYNEQGQQIELAIGEEEKNLLEQIKIVR